MLWLLSVLLSTVCVALAKSVNVSLDVPWTPISEGILTLETISQYNSSAFFPLLSALINERMQPQGCPDEVEFLFTAAEKSGFLKPSTIPLVRQELAVGAVIPSVEAQFHMFADIGEKQDCPVVMWNEGTYSCDRKSLYTPDASASHKIPDLLLNDRVIGNGDQWLLVYADLDSSEFPDWHESFLELALSGKVSYVLRQRPSTSTNSIKNQTVKLAGYGVGFNLKRTDYLVVDDRMSDGELKLDLDAPNQVPASKVESLGFAATRRIRELKGDGAAKFEALEDLSFNFPNHAVKLAAEFDNKTADTQQATLLDSAGINAVFIDGILLKAANTYTFFDALHKETDLLSTLEYELPADVNIPSLLTSGITHDGSDDSYQKQRYDLSISGSAIVWLNDIEKNSIYDYMEDDLSLLTELEGSFIPLKRNIHSIVIAGDLEDKSTIRTMYSIFREIRQSIPLQIGLVSSSQDWLDAAELGFEARKSFLASLFSGVTLSDALKSVRDSTELDQEVGDIPDKADVDEFYDRFGIDVSNGPVVFINGFPLNVENWTEMAMVVFENDMAYLRGLKDLDPKQSLRDTLFATGESRRNKIIDPLEIDFIEWPLTSPIQPFQNPEKQNDTSDVKHSVLLSSSFRNSHTLDIAEILLQRSTDQNDCDVFIRPLNGIDPRFYKSLLDPTYSMFRFSLDLIKAARGHLYQRKSEPRVFTVAKEPEFKVENLPEETDSLIIDGRYIELTSDITDELLNKLIDRETARVKRIQKNVPGINGLGIAALTKACETRNAFEEDTIPDIVVESNISNITVTLIVDPASPEGQTHIALGKLAKEAGLRVEVLLSSSKLEELPKRIYQPALNRHIPVKFANLGNDTLYSVELVEPKSWVTMAAKCDYDLDNFVLNQVKEEELEVIYTLRSLLIEGFAAGKPAPGTAIELHSVNGEKISDTSVMANLGYFQFQVHSPGVYFVCLPDNKKSILSQNVTNNCVATGVFDFTGTTLRTLITDSAPQNTRKINTDSSGSSSYWDSLKNAIGNSKSKDKHADINIFTVASGHLYERFASIMMLSVMKHTKHKVKFWLIENFLSPKFKQFIPEFAEHYRFDYELISYKWPEWLRGQSEKQRQIWGYKMLFLDTLFPQSLSDVIFVDSDQIVRTDFMELLNMDLQGAPYAFTPMGDDREEMEPYRFWKKGFWKEALIDKGLKYHISALYRVDLDTFRKGHVGDILREHYQRLSANPTNLANLDQDLPNSLQTVIPIYSLPQEWLWCETWCSDEALSEAKTIDLCNNPLTKEPKLDRARRQIPEWIEYDNLVSEFSAKVANTSADNKDTRILTEKNPEVSDKSIPIDVVEEDHPNIHSFVDEVDIHDEL